MYGLDVYTNPAMHGLETVGDCDFSSGEYEFNMTAVWRNPATGQLYYADDAGCSCPSPFENITRIDQLTPATRHEILAHLSKRADASYTRSLNAAMPLIQRIAYLPTQKRDY